MTTDMMTDFQEGLEERILSGKYETFDTYLAPADAKLLLDFNTNNRSAREKVSNQYALEMKEGRWMFAADPIRFDDKGMLLDGQHRLSALAGLLDSHPDISIRFVIVVGLDSRSQLFMDQGRKRSVGDNLALNGLKSSTDVASSARAYLLWTSGRIFTAMEQIANTEIQEWVLSHPDFVETCYEVIRLRKQMDLPVSFYVAAYAVFKEIDADDARDFLEKWATGIGLDAGSPILALRERLARIRREKTRIREKDHWAMMISAWNAYRLNKTLVRFPRPSGGAWNKDNFPNPI